MATIPVYLAVDDGALIPGPSAYDVAVANGFVGTVAQWLESLQGGAVNEWRYSPISGDNTTAFNEFMADAVAAGVRSVSIGAAFELHSKPTLPAGIRITGDGSSTSHLIRCYSGDCIEFSAGFNGGLHRLAVVAASGTSGGFGIGLKATSSQSPDYSSFSDLVVTGFGGTFAWPLVIDGSLRSSPQGVRDVCLTNINLFAGTSGALSITNGVGINFFGLGAFPAGGTSGAVYVTGNSNTIGLYGANVQGELNLTSCTKVRFDGHLISLNTAGTASKCYITGSHGGGSIVNNLTASAVGLV